MSQNTEGNLWIVGGSSLDQVLLMREAEALITRLERVTGLPRRPVGSRLGVLLVDAEAVGPPHLATSLFLKAGVLEQRLRISALSQATPLMIDTALCRLLLWGQVVDQGPKPDAVGASRAAWVERDVPAAVPEWVVEGMLGCLMPARRATSSERLWAQWREGRLPPLAVFLRAPAPDVRADYGTLIVEWLGAQTSRTERFQAIFAQLATGGALSPEWLAAALTDSGAVVDLEEQWDAWLLAQPRRVLAPGRTRPSDLARLREELWVTRGEQGVPDDPALPRRLPLSSLITMADARWVPGVAHARILKLRTLALGRGPGYQQAVEAWCVYLQALGARAPARRLAPLLAAAQSAQSTLDAELAPPTP